MIYLVLQQHTEDSWYHD